MKNLNELKKEKYIFTSTERSKVDSVIEDLKFIKTREISEEGYKRICAIEKEVKMLRDQYTHRFINLLKQGHMV